MSDKTMTMEREAKILERATMVLGEYELLAAGAAGAKALSKALLDYGIKITSNLDAEQEREQLLKALGEVKVWVNLLEMVVDDCTEQEIDYLQYLDKLTRHLVTTYINVAEQIKAEDEAAAEEAGVATMDEPEGRVVQDGDAE